MCRNCYHSIGRDRKAWKCKHINKLHYAHGVCKNCYHHMYLKNSRNSKDKTFSHVNNFLKKKRKLSSLSVSLQ